MTNKKNEVIATLLVSREGVVELGMGDSVRWARLASGEESSLAEARLHDMGLSAKQLAYDGLGNPYFWTTILSNAPAEIQQQVRNKVRAFKLYVAEEDLV